MSDDAETPLRSHVANAILDAAAEAVITCDRDGTICFWNPGATRIFGFAADEATGKSLDIIIPERLRERHWTSFHAMMARGQSRYPEGHVLSVPAQRKDGAALSIDFTVTALKDRHGQTAYIVAVMRDVTARFEELKTLRRQLQSGAAR